MSRSQTFLKLGLVAAATTALALAATAPVSAHTGSLFTFVQDSQFATVGAADASLTPLGPVQSFGTSGLDILGDTAYALNARYSTTNTLYTWNHSTGEVISSTELTDAPGYNFNSGVWGLDVKSDGTILAFAEQMTGNDDYGVWVVSISTDGVVTPRVELNDLAFSGLAMNAIATDPTDGATYVFLYNSDGSPQYVSVDLTLGTHSALVALAATRTALGDGSIAGADFDPSGTLWFYYGAFDADTVLASSTGEFGASMGAVVSGSAGTAEAANLAYDPAAAVIPAAPQLPSTGVDAAALVMGAIALFGAGAIALLILRRRTA